MSYPPPPMPFAQQPPQPKRNQGRNIAIIIGGVALGIVLIGCCALCFVVPTDKESTGSSASSESPSSSSGDEDESSASKEEDEVAGMKDEVTDGGFQFVVTDVEDGVEQIGDEYLNSTPQGQFVVIHVTVKNTGDSAELFSDSLQKAVDSDGKEHSTDSEASLYIPDNEVLLEEINPGNEIDAQLVFDIPEDAELKTIALYGGAMSQGVEVNLS